MTTKPQHDRPTNFLGDPPQPYETKPQHTAEPWLRNAAISFGENRARRQFEGRKGHGGNPQLAERHYKQEQVAALLAVGFECGAEYAAANLMRDALRAENARQAEQIKRLKEALEAMQAACDEWAAEFTQKKRAMDWGVVNDAYCKASAALAESE